MFYKATDAARCPHCGKVALGPEVERDFGYRTCDEKAQSWCKKCRGIYKLINKKGKESK